MKTIKFLSLSLIATLFFASCSSDDNSGGSGPVNEEEVITTLKATLNGGGQTITLTSRDLDGAEGPNAPIVTVSGNFAPSTTYNGSLDLLNEAATPAESITAEILEEADDHQFFFNVSNALGSFAYASPNDENGHPVGLNFTFTTGATAGTGNLTITLRHQPNKSGEGVSSGNIANAGGETDIQVTFPIVIAVQ
ncbi:type 1 periplasmic binding fold superfamily protein [uncultured Flavobacterium sp.]|uniref:type 1 periplasmic binding fold superfamily protein n=1 Tax=uncultured Flavobacterium sp. TaxID=165435 RepID=UPI0025E66E29|nr:type 1 periplasmic binding fold superfamily protein [uncultured Flavobacterium sp.]